MKSVICYLCRLDEKEKVIYPHCPKSPAKQIPAAILVPFLGGPRRAHVQNSV